MVEPLTFLLPESVALSVALLSDGLWQKNRFSPPEGHVSLIHHLEDRPKHDCRYALDTKKMRLLGWHTEMLSEQGVKDTVRFI